MKDDRFTRILLGAGIFAFGLWISMYFGRQGLNPLDSCIVFDGAWREISGQHVFVDWSAPNGFVPIGIQALFFRVLGVSWWVYCLHAAIFNGLFALLVLDVLWMAGAPRWLAAGYAVLSAVVFYPPMGVPYMDQHAFFFVLLAVWVGMKAKTVASRWRFWLWFSVPVVCLMAILSKQSPGLLALPVSVLVLVCWGPMREGVSAAGSGQQWRRLAGALLLGLVPAFFCFVVFVGWPWTVGEAFWENFWVRPQALGSERFAEWNYGAFKTVRTMAWFPFQTLSGHNFLHLHLLYVPFLLLLVEWGLRKLLKRPRAAWPAVRLLLLGIALTLVCSFFMRFTWNQPENGLPLALVAIGLGHVFWREWLKGFEFANGWKPFRALLMGFSFVLLGYAGLATADFHLRVNVPRYVLDFTPDFPFVENPVSRGYIGFLEYQAPYHYQALEPWELIDWMKRNQGEYLLFGDLSLVYGLSGRASNSPFLWVHEGLTLPRTGTPAFEAADGVLLEVMNRNKVRYLIFEHPERFTFMHLRFDEFRKTYAAALERKAAEFYIGGFMLWDLGK
jgi:hypothetical protein